MIKKALVTGGAGFTTEAKTCLVTGGAGFIGTNLVLKLLKDGCKVTVFDNLSRRGTKVNLELIKKGAPRGHLEVITKDVRQKNVFDKLVNTDAIFHLAAQTAVTTSLTNPGEDLDINLFGTFNLLESMRKNKSKAVIVYASTNKVYGSLDYLKHSTLVKGISEDTNLDFHSPYGCSKGSAESYVRDYSRIYGINSVVFRQSCIYGTHQMGVEDQGWVAHIGASAILNKTVNIYGNGRQIRDLLYVDDLINLYLLAVKNSQKVKGMVFNVGGGAKNAISVLRYISFLSNYLNKHVKTINKNTRPGDQKIFISDNSLVKKVLDWQPEVGYKKGLPMMLSWIKENQEIFKNL
jgi:CDP-paratose 2-epimerase